MKGCQQRESQLASLARPGTMWRQSLGLSTAGLQMGMRDQRSALIREVFRAWDELPKPRNQKKFGAQLGSHCKGISRFKYLAVFMMFGCEAVLTFGKRTGVVGQEGKHERGDGLHFPGHWVY